MGKDTTDNLKKSKRIRALIRLRCGNMENYNRYWLEEDTWLCVFCEKGLDATRHYVEECEVVREWFILLGRNTEERMARLWSDELDEMKEKILLKLWDEKETVRKRVKVVNRGRQDSEEENE